MQDDSSKTIVAPSGRVILPASAKGKNARKKAIEMRKKMAEEEALKKLGHTPLKFWTMRDFPDGWRRPQHRYAVCARIRHIQQDHMYKQILWMKANLGGALGYVPTDDDMKAAKGINLMDLMPRIGLMVCFITMDKSEAEQLAKKVHTELDVSVQVLTIGEWNVVPPYTTSGVIYQDKEMAKLMEQYAKDQREDHETRRKKMLELNSQVMKINAKAGTMTQEEIDAEEARLSLGMPKSAPLVTGFRKLAIDTTEIDASEAAEDREAALAMGEDEPTKQTVHLSWQDEVASSKNPTRAITNAIYIMQSTVDLHKRQIVSLQDRIAEIEIEISKANVQKSEIEENNACLDDCSGTDSDDDDIPKQTIRKIITAPNGEKYKILLTGEMLHFGEGETEDSFEIAPSSAADDVPLQRSSRIGNMTRVPLVPVGVDPSLPVPERMKRYAEVMSGADAPISDIAKQAMGAGDENYHERFSSMQAAVDAHNAKVLAEREEYDRTHTPEMMLAELEALTAKRKP